VTRPENLRSASPRARGAARAALLAAVVAAGGCLNKPALTVQSYSIDAPRRATPSPLPGGRTLTLEAVQVAPPYSGRSFVYRSGEHRLEKDAYAQFGAPPAWLLTAAIRGYLENAAFVRDVFAPGGLAHTDARIDTDAIDLYGELGGSGEAVLTLRFRVLRPAVGSTPATELMNRTYTRRLALAERTPGALADGWNRALAEIMAEFTSELGPLLMSDRPTEAKHG